MTFPSNAIAEDVKRYREISDCEIWAVINYCIKGKNLDVVYAGKREV